MTKPIRDQQLASLLDQLHREERKGQRIDIDRVASEHPELAPELRELWATAQFVGTVAEQSTPPFTEKLEPVGASELPDGVPSKLEGYEIYEELGRGGMGVIYRARQKSLDRMVAVKLILRGTLASEEDRQRFLAEATAAAQLDHPNIVPIYEVGDHNGQLFFSMPVIAGKTLAERLAEGPMAGREAARLVMEVATGIDFAHQRGIVHRDLKPANILIDPQGVPHVSDFGLAKRLAGGTSLTRTGAVLGTPSYMAPEQASGNLGEIGPACDVYSLGTILYALTTGRPPFQGPSAVDTVLMLLDQEPLPPRLLNRNADRELEMIILRCLQKPPDLRYRSAAALADDLAAYLSGNPIAARRGHLSHIWGRLSRETHHAAVLENWGLLWMWHAVVLLAICLVTNAMVLNRDRWPVLQSPLPYLLLWGGALSVWAPTFWRLRYRAGPVTSVERQITHAWGASIISVMLLFVVESILGLPVLKLAPVLGLMGGSVFVVKAGILNGSFYLYALALFATSLVMAWMERAGIEYSITVFGLVSAAAYFLPGWKYYRRYYLQAEKAKRN